MNLWRLEWLRLVRTRRLLVVLAVYVFFGLSGPVTTRYLPQILNRVGNGVQVQLPPPTPAQGLAQFANNASQIGLLVALIIAASALAVDSRTEMAIFLRTRVSSLREIIVPAYAMSTAAAVAAQVAGTAAAWYETAILLGAPSPASMLLGTAFAALFLVFAVACTAVVAYVARSVLATVGITLVIMLVMATLGSVPHVGRWLPTTLLSALPKLVSGSPASDFYPSAVVALVVTVAALPLAVRLASRREL
jgi:ABC-2 type transport system permease protein